MIGTGIKLLLALCDTLVTAYTIDKIVDNKKIKNTGVFVAIYYTFIALKVLLVPDNVSGMEAAMLSITPIVIIISVLCMKYKRRIMGAIMAALMLYIAVVVVQLVSFFLVSTVINPVAKMSTQSDQFVWIVQIMYMTITVVMVRKFGKKLNSVHIKVMKYVSNKYQKILKGTKIAISVIAITSLAGVGVQIFSDTRVKDDVLMLTALIMLMVLLIVGITYYESVVTSLKEAESARRTKELEEKNKIKMVHNEFVECINKFGHSYNNMIQTIDFMLSDEDIDFEAIRPILRDLVQWDEKNKINHKMRFVNIPNMLVASILSIKLEKADELGVAMIVNYNGDYDVEVETKDFIDVLGILIDNAIEAAYYADCKVVDINILFDEEQFLLEIENEFKRDDKGNIMKYGDSKKIGLKNIDDITAMSKDMEIKIFKGDNTFKARLLVYQAMADRSGNGQSENGGVYQGEQGVR